MDRTRLTLSALLAAALVGDVVLLSTGLLVEVVATVPAESTELLTRDKDTLLTEATKAAASPAFTCEVRTLRFGRTPREVCWCDDGQGAAWESSADDCYAEVTVSDGVVYTRERTVLEADAVERVR